MTTIQELSYQAMVLFEGEGCGALMPSVREGQLSIYVDCSDAFFWGSADAEELTPETLPILQQAAADLEAAGADNHHLDHLFAARVRKMRPQGACYEFYDEPALRAMFDACGPERVTGLGNPHPPKPPRCRLPAGHDGGAS